MNGPRRWIVVALALVGASIFAMSVWVGAWWSIGDITIGPLATRSCFAGDCTPRWSWRGGLEWIGGSLEWERVAVATGGAGLVAMCVLIALAGAAAAGRAPRLAAKTTLVAIATALAVGAYFVAAFPGLDGARLGAGGALFAAAALVGVAAAVVVLRSPRSA